MKKLNRKKMLALPLSLLIAVPVAVQSTVAFIVAQTQPAVNTFKPFDSIEGGLVIRKTLEHPYGREYTIPPNVDFDFEVKLGKLYAGYTVKTSEGDVLADENGTITVSVKPDVLFGIEGIDEGMEVTITELETGGGFTAQSEATQNAVISPNDFVTVEFVNRYTPEPMTPPVSVSGLVLLEGRDWQTGDTFELLFEMQDENGEWITLGTDVVTYTEGTPDFNTFDFLEVLENLQINTIGTHTFRITEVQGDIEYVTYDDKASEFSVVITDDDMDGYMEFRNVTADKNVTVLSQPDGSYQASMTFTNIYKLPEETTTTESTSTSESTTTTTGSDTVTDTETTTSGTETTTTDTTEESTTTKESTTKESTTTKETTTTKDTTTTKATTTTKDTTTTTTNTTTTTDTTTTETTTTTEATTTTEPAATWTIGKVDAHPGDTGVVVPIRVSDDTGLISYLFDLKIGDGPILKGAEEGDAYEPLDMLADLVAAQFGGTNVKIGENIIAEDGSIVLNLIFDIPVDAQPGKYLIEFAGDVTAYTADGLPLNITEQGGYINILPPEIAGYRYEVTGKDKFYFAHDPRPFKAEDLINTITRYTLYTNGTESAGELVSDWTTVDIAFDIVGFRNAEEVYETQILDENGDVKKELEFFACYRGSVPVTIEGVRTETDSHAYIAVKGDVTLDGIPNALDAATILVYAAERGAGNDAWLYDGNEQTLEYFAYFLGDVTGESKNYGEDGSDMNALDAANILVYAAERGAGLEPLWENVLSEPLPIYTKEIAEYNAALAAQQEERRLAQSKAQ